MVLKISKVATWVTYGSADGTDNGGMSSRGCSRWAFGHTSSRGPVASDDSNYPGDSNGNGDFWSVTWEDAFQILTHYYTGVHIRDENGSIITSEYRWNPLKVDWNGSNTPPDTIIPAQSVLVTLYLQNTGTTTWGDNIKLAYYWVQNNTIIGSIDLYDVDNLDPGAGNVTTGNITLSLDVPAELETGQTASLIFDLRNVDDSSGAYFSNREADEGRFWFELSYDFCVGGICRIIPLAFISLTFHPRILFSEIF